MSRILAYLTKNPPMSHSMNAPELSHISNYNVLLHGFSSTTSKSSAIDSFDRMFNATTENYQNTTNLFMDLFDGNVSRNDTNSSTSHNIDIEELYKKDHVFDRTDVRVIFIIVFSLVFCFCFFGNLLVILVVTMSRRLRSITNFFLANLAVADLCVGVFCVIQTLTFYLIDSWVFGEFLCKMYQFVHSLSYTASIFILMIICMERYFAIIFPITCKQILTSTRLRLVVGGVWITSALYSIPKFLYSRTITNVHQNGVEEVICIMHRGLFNSKLLDSINFAALYLIPLLVMTALYTRIAVALWKSSQGIERHIAMLNTSNHSNNATAAANNLSNRTASKYEKRPIAATESQVSVDSDKVVTTTWRTQSFHHRHHHHHHHNHQHQHQHTGHTYQVSHSSNNVLRARRGVIRMLIIVVLTFAVCNLPLHARKMWQYWSANYHGESNFSALLTPITFLISYFNSAFNPLLYAFLSRNFRKGMREIILCSFKKSNNKSIQQRIPLHNHSLPTDTSHVGNLL